MTRCWWLGSWKWRSASSVLVGGAIAYLGDCALAQITPDGTLPNNSIVTPQGNTSVISGGHIAGSNLFHSFEKFSVPTGGVAYFNNALNIQNIISRVTGGEVSNIDGLLRANGTANLFLLNPNGIIFGPNATLAIGGSFAATTANAIQFGNQGFFSASAPNNPGLLTVNPSAFLFNQIAAKPITNQPFQSFEGLQVLDGRSLLLVGGDVRLDSGIMLAPGGRVELGGVAGSGTVGLNVDGNNLRLSYPDQVRRADVSLTNGAFVNVTAAGGGSIAINAQNLDVLEASSLYAGIEPGVESVGSKAGDITLDATGAMKIAGSIIANEVGFGAVGNTGSILIKAGSLSLTDGAVLAANTFGQGVVGRISVQADKSVFIATGSTVTTGSLTPRKERGVSVGSGGDINIQTETLSLTDNALLDTSTSGEDRAGDVFIDARDTVSVENSLISSETFGIGNAGIIDIKARALSLTEGAELGHNYWARQCRQHSG